MQNIGSSADRLPPVFSAIMTSVDGLNTVLVSAQPDGNVLACPNYLDPAWTPTEAANLITVLPPTVELPRSGGTLILYCGAYKCLETRTYKCGRFWRKWATLESPGETRRRFDDGQLDRLILSVVPKGFAIFDRVNMCFAEKLVKILVCGAKYEWYATFIDKNTRSPAASARGYSLSNPSGR